MAVNVDDPFGHELIKERIAQIPLFLMSMLQEKPDALSSLTISTPSFILTGIGSSEAHARYLTLLLNLYTNRQATFIRFTGLMTMNHTFDSDRVLILFSQGLSPNAQMILKCSRERFSHVVLFTSMDEKQIMNKCPWINTEKLEIIQFPLHNEYVTLIRVIGPICGFLAAIRFIERLTGKKLIEAQQLNKICTIKSSSFSLLRQVLIDDSEQQFSRGPFYIMISSPLIDVCQNLGYKFVEGIYWTPPIICDYLQFAHGPFQQIQSITDRPSAILCLVDKSNAFEVELESRLRMMIDQCNDAKHRTSVYTFYLSTPSSVVYSIFEIEMEFNRLIYEIMCTNKCDQIHWPGKGQDQPLYSFQG